MVEASFLVASERKSELIQLASICVYLRLETN